jgi:hypothetical protein
VKELKQTEGTEGHKVPPLPELEWEKIEYSLYRAVDGEENYFEKAITELEGSDWIYLVILNQEKYGKLKYGDSKVSLEKAWEEAFEKTMSVDNRRKKHYMEELKKLEAKLTGVSIDQVEVEIRIKKKEAV